MNNKSETNITRLDTIETGAIDFDSSVPCLIVSWIGFTTSKEFRPFMERGLERIKEKAEENNQLGWIADISQSEIFSPEDIAWVAECWNPKANQGGIKYIAFVVSENAFAELTADDYTEQSQAEGKIIVNHFKDMESSKAWLREVLN